MPLESKGLMVNNAGSLRLWPAKHPVGATNSRRCEARQAAGRRTDDRDARPAGHELVQAGRR